MFEYLIIGLVLIKILGWLWIKKPWQRYTVKPQPEHFFTPPPPRQTNPIPDEEAKKDEPFPPYTQLQPNGFYIYIDMENGIRRLLDADEKNFLKRDFRTIEYVGYANVYICRGPDFCAVYDVAQNQLIETPFEDVRIDVFGHKMYSSNNQQFGLLNENYQPSIKPKPASQFLTGVAPGVLKYYQHDCWYLMNNQGETILGRMLWIAPGALNNKILVRFLDLSFALAALDGTILKRLPYEEMFINIPLAGNAGPDGIPRYYIAGFETAERLPHHTKRKKAYTVLNSDAEQMFTPCYDYLTYFNFDGTAIFMAGIGDMQLWSSLLEESSDEPPRIEGSMRYGVIDAHNNIILPFIYSTIERTNQPFYKVGQHGQVVVVETTDEYDDEKFWDWEIHGIQYGIVSLEGNPIIPLSFAAIHYTPNKDGSVAYFTALREGDDTPAYFDAEGNALDAPVRIV